MERAKKVEQQWNAIKKWNKSGTYRLFRVDRLKKIYFFIFLLCLFVCMYPKHIEFLVAEWGIAVVVVGLVAVCNRSSMYFLRH